MFKLLSEESRAKVRKEYVLRRHIVVLTLLILVLIIALVGIFPSYILSKGRQEEMAERFKMMGGQSASSTPQDDLSLWLANINQKLKILSPALDNDRASLIIGKALAVKGIGISVTQLSWQKGETASLSLNGVATDRQTLLAFEKNLNDSGEFQSVSLPVSNLAKVSSIPFQVKLILKQSR